MNKVVINDSFGGFLLSDEAVAYLEERLPQEIVVDAWGWDGMTRHHPLLVEVVEMLGVNASGSNPSHDYASELVVVSIAEDRYFITVEDGMESLETPSSLPSRWVVIGGEG